MNNDIPNVKKTAWVPATVHILLQAGLIYCLWKLWFPNKLVLAVIYGAGSYLVYSRLSRAIVLRPHHRGVKFLRAGMYQEAIDAFQSMYHFLDRHSWIDRYRYVVLLSESAIPYRAAALCNIAYGYWMLNDNASSLEYYRKTLESYPNSDSFKAALETVEAAQHSRII